MLKKSRAFRGSLDRRRGPSVAEPASYWGPPEVAERMICRMEEPITTKMKKPSMTGPTAKPYLDFSLALMSTRPRLWMFLWNLAEDAAKTRLEAACHGNTDGGAWVSHVNRTDGAYRWRRG